MMIPVVEIYGPVLQGEGPLIGLPSIFVRTGGCDYRCLWCDSMFAVTPDAVKKNSTEMTCEDIVRGVVALAEPVGGLPVITLTGGNPCLWDLMEVVLSLRTLGYQVAVETQATLHPAWVKGCDHVIMSPKPPSAGRSTELATIDEFMRFSGMSSDGTAWGFGYFKIVVKEDREDDYLYAKNVRTAFPQVPMYLTPCTSVPQQVHVLATTTIVKPARISKVRKTVLDACVKLSERVLSDPDMRGVSVLPQYHVLMYGVEARGK